MSSNSEENYLKTIFHIGFYNHQSEVSTKEIAQLLDVKPASVNEMLKKLKEKSFVNYEKYGKIQLTEIGKLKAINVIRNHRLWETFLYEKLDFTWDEVHEIAEELEHITSKKLINKLDKFLGYPEYDPHGDPIPNEKGDLKFQSKKCLTEIEIGKTCKMVAVKDNSSPFLQYIVSLGLGLNNQIKVISRESFDGLTVIEINRKQKVVSQKFTDNVLVI